MKKVYVLLACFCLTGVLFAAAGYDGDNETSSPKSAAGALQEDEITQRLTALRNAPGPQVRATRREIVMLEEILKLREQIESQQVKDVKRDGIIVSLGSELSNVQLQISTVQEEVKAIRENLARVQAQRSCCGCLIQ